MQNIYKKTTLTKIAIITSVLFAPIHSWANQQTLSVSTQQAKSQGISQFKSNQEYQQGDIVQNGNWVYKSDDTVTANTFIPGAGNPWEKYQDLVQWQNTKTYYGGNKVLMNGHAYQSAWWSKNQDPTDPKNQNTATPTPGPWTDLGPWHNLTNQERAAIKPYNPGYTYHKSDYVKGNKDIYTATQEIHGIGPLQKSPWEDVIIWNNISSNVHNQSTQWPSHTFSPYVDMLQNPPSLSSQNEIGVNHFTMAFVIAKQNQCLPSWGGQQSLNLYNYDNLNRLRDNNGDAMLSIGGANGLPLANVCEDVTQLTKNYTNLVQNLYLNALDFDIEGAALNDKKAADRRSQALYNAQQEWKVDRPVSIWITLPVAPQGLTAQGEYQIQSLINHHVKFSGINLMTMDYGTNTMNIGDCKPTRTKRDPNDPNSSWVYADNQFKAQGDCGVVALKNTEQFLYSEFQKHNEYKFIPEDQVWSMLGTTPMIGVNDAGQEILYPKGAQTIADDAKQHHLGIVSMWSLNRDISRADGETSDQGDSINTGLPSDQPNNLPQKYIFAKILNGSMKAD